LTGDIFLGVNLPELQLNFSPDLVMSGQDRQATVQGTVTVPEALVRGRQGRAPIHSSPDLVIVDAPAREDRTLPIDLELKVTVILGDRVLVNTGGLEARLTGQVLVEGQVPDGLTGRGRIDVAKGTYGAYGVRLEISRGSLVFSGGPVDEPVLDVLALRTVEEVKAGVRVTGLPRRPTVRLYSDPGMPDTDVLAYIVLGHPLGSDSGQAGLLFAAAGALLSQGESVGIQEQLKRRLGIDVLDVQTSQGDTTESIVTVGKYLNPKLYISIGQSVFTNTSQVGLSYNMGRHWQVESSMGTESGIDLYYRITFK
jgi:translocation and assembly module TamB